MRIDFFRRSATAPRKVASNASRNSIESEVEEDDGDASDGSLTSQSLTSQSSSDNFDGLDGGEKSDDSSDLSTHESSPEATFDSDCDNGGSDAGADADADETTFQSKPARARKSYPLSALDKEDVIARAHTLISVSLSRSLLASRTGSLTFVVAPSLETLLRNF